MFKKKFFEKLPKICVFAKFAKIMKILRYVVGLSESYLNISIQSLLMAQKGVLYTCCSKSAILNWISTNLISSSAFTRDLPSKKKLKYVHIFSRYFSNRWTNKDTNRQKNKQNQQKKITCLKAGGR